MRQLRGREYSKSDINAVPVVSCLIEDVSVQFGAEFLARGGDVYFERGDVPVAGPTTIKRTSLAVLAAVTPIAILRSHLSPRRLGRGLCADALVPWQHPLRRIR